LQQSLIDHLIEVVPDPTPEVLTRTLDEIDTLMADDRDLSTAAMSSLETVRNLLADLAGMKRDEIHHHLAMALKVMSRTLEDEALQREQLLESISLDIQSELYVALAIFAGILFVAILFLHFRILHPLNDLKELLQRLTEENYTPITTDHLDPLLLPVFNSYNEMVKHLAELEETNRLHAQSLQQEVRLATRTLLEQQHSLARADRLAVIGELAAELAHEIRNPLAGIQMAFSNFRRETDDIDQRERLDLIDSELKRMARLLNDMLTQSRHSPEAPTAFDVAKLIRELVVLARYQVAESIHLEIDASSRLLVHLPEGGLRQALLNLILNAADALEENSGLIRIKARKDNESLQIDVLDNGAGFSQDMLDHGIRPFRTSHQRGTGLGLAMVQRFVKDVDGAAIKLTNWQPHGACVSLLLPQKCFADNKL